MRKMAYLYSIFFLLLLCANPKRENPFDTNSENWFPPVVKGMGAVSVSINDSVMLTATASDKNGYIVQFLWALDGGSFNQATAVGSIKTIFTTCGNFIVPVKAVDNDGVVSTPDTIKITVTLNPPTVTAMPDCSVPLNDSITITAEGNDPNGYITQYLWALNGLVYNDTTVTGTLRTVFKDSGIFCVKVKVKDDDGLISLPDSVKITVVSNPPSVVMLTHDTIVPINDTLLLKATGTDPNGIIVKYLWRMDNNLHSDSTDSGSIKFVFMNSGMHTVKVKVRDDDGLFSQDASVKITVISYPPSVCILNHDTSILINDTIRVRATGIDSNGVIMKYIWTIDNKIHSDSTDSGCIKVAFPDSGMHTVRVQVRDDDGLFSPPDSIKIYVTLAPPILTHKADTVVSQIDTARIKVIAVDTNAGGRIEKYYWDIGGNGWDDSTDSPNYNVAFPQGGFLTVIWAARDDDCNLVTDTFKILFNRVPSGVSLKAPPSNKAWQNFNFSNYKGDLPLALSGTDPDGSQDTLTYHLYIGSTQNTLIKEYDGKDTVYNAKVLDTNTTYWWKLVVTDRYGDSASVNGTFITPGAPQSLTVSKPGLSPTCCVTTNASNDTFEVWNAGSGDMNFTISDTMAWLSCEPVSGISTGPFDKKSVVVKYASVSLAEGTYTGSISVTSAKREQKSIVVTLMVTKPGFGLSATTIMDTCQEGLNPSSKGFSVYNSGTGILKFKVSASVTWLSCSPDSGTSANASDKKQIALVYNAANFNTGIYSANITVSGSGLNAKVITVTLVVLKRPQPAINVDSLKISCLQGFSPSYDSLYVWNSGGGTLNFTITDTVNWLQCIPDKGCSAGTNDKVKVKVIYSCDALYCGRYSGLIRISADNSNGGTPVTNRVELAVKQNWLQTTPAAPFSARSDHTTVVFDNKIWVIGGYAITIFKNDVWYSTDGTSWTQATGNAGFSARYGHASVAFDNKIWVIGGWDSGVKNDVWYSTDGTTWQQATGNAGFSARRDHGAVLFDNKIWVIGGCNGGAYNDVWCSTDGTTWQKVTSNAGFTARYEHSTIVFDNKIWVIGGRDAGGVVKNDVWYSTDGITWQQATGNAGFSTRYKHTSVISNNKIWVIGGFSTAGVARNDVWYSTDGITWVEATSNAGFSVRFEHSSVMFENKIWVIGGRDGGGVKNDVWYSDNR